jgi:DNA-binding MarR family transcriptional regulator
MAPLTRAPAAGDALDDARRLAERWMRAPDDRLAHLVKDATRAFARALSLRLAAHGVSFGHWTFLRVLWQRDGLTQRELSVEAGVMEPTTAAAVRRMEALGYVARRKRAGNRKNVHVHLTARGRALERRLVPLAVEVNRIAVRTLDPADVETVRRTLVAMLANLARDER